MSDWGSSRCVKKTFLPGVSQRTPGMVIDTLHCVPAREAGKVMTGDCVRIAKKSSTFLIVVRASSPVESFKSGNPCFLLS